MIYISVSKSVKQTDKSRKVELRQNHSQYYFSLRLPKWHAMSHLIFQMEFPIFLGEVRFLCHQGLTKVPFSQLGQVEFSAWQVTFCSQFHSGKGPGQVVLTY